MIKPKTIELLTTTKVRRRKHPKRVLLCESTKEGKRLQRQYSKARRAIANKLRNIRRTNSHYLARVWARAT